MAVKPCVHNRCLVASLLLLVSVVVQRRMRRVFLIFGIVRKLCSPKLDGSFKVVSICLRFALRFVTRFPSASRRLGNPLEADTQMCALNTHACHGDYRQEIESCCKNVGRSPWQTYSPTSFHQGEGAATQSLRLARERHEIAVHLGGACLRSFRGVHRRSADQASPGEYELLRGTSRPRRPGALCALSTCSLPRWRRTSCALSTCLSHKAFGS